MYIKRALCVLFVGGREICLEMPRKVFVYIFELDLQEDVSISDIGSVLLQTDKSIRNARQVNFNMQGNMLKKTGVFVVIWFVISVVSL